MARQPLIRTVQGLVDNLGRPFLQDWLGLSGSAISLWISRDNVPRDYHLQLYFELKRRRLKFDCGALFGITEDGHVVAKTPELIRFESRPSA